MIQPPLTHGPTPGHSHTHTLIFLHGRADRAPRFAETLLSTPSTHLTTLSSSFPSFRLIFPQAPDRQLSASPKENIQPLWFDDSDPSKRQSQQPLVNLQRSLPGSTSIGGGGSRPRDTPALLTLRDMLPQLRSLLISEAARLNNRWDKIIVAGISMGGATVSQLLLTLDIPRECGGRLGAVLLFASWSPFPDMNLTQIRDALGGGYAPRDEVVIRNTPVLIEHARDDHVVSIEQGRKLRDDLKSFGATVTWREYNEGRHWFGQPHGMDDAISFIEKRVVGAKKVKERGIKAYIQSIIKRIFR